MASPFKFFRKHQGSMMVVLVILAMLAFTLGDLFTSQGTNPWLLGLLVGGAVFGIAGISSGRWLQWGIGGAIIGTLLGLVLPEFTQPAGVIATSFGIIEQEELNDLAERRAVANGFMMLATEEVYGPVARQFPVPFSFGHRNSQQDLLFGRLMQEEADALGITVTDDMVRKYINTQTQDKLSRESFAKARSALLYQNSPVLDETLFDILREQIRNKLAHLALVPDESVAPASPEVHWEFFKRLNVRQSIHVAELDVDAFVDQVQDPSETEITTLFEQAKNKQPNQDEPGSPGFFLPGRAQIAWLELDYDSVEASIPPVTDEEIQTYYDENRDTQYRTIVIPEKPKADSAETSSADETPEAEQSVDPAPAEETPEAAADPAADSDSSEEAAETPSSDSDADDGQPAAADEPTSDEPKTEESSSEEPAADSVGEEQSPADGSGDSDSGGQFSIDDPEAAAVPEEESAPDATETESPDAPDSPQDQEPAAAPAITDDSTETPADTAFPSQLMLPSEAERESADDAAMEPEYEYRELDNELRSEIREVLLEQKVAAAIDDRMVAAWEFLRSLQSELSQRRADIMKEDQQKYISDPDAAAVDLRREMAQFTPELLERMEQYADENGFVYASTKQLVSFQDFSDEDNYPLGIAVEPNRPDFQSAGFADTVAYQLFSGFGTDVAANDAQLFIPKRAVYRPPADDGTESHYAYWAVEFVEPHVPTLDEPGVREQVILAFKREKARELLMKRAEELAQKVRDGLAKEGDDQETMAATLESESITGEPDSATLTVRSSLPFAWLRQSQTPQTSFQPRRPRAELSRIRFADGVSSLTGVGQEFMKTVFEDMDNEEVGVAPNPDRTRYFIVHVTNRFPTEDRGIEGLRDRFLSEGRMNFMSSPVTGLMRSEIVSPVVMAWERSIWIKYGVNPDEEPTQS